MRRSQSVRNHARPSFALGTDDLGVLTEGEEPIEDTLRRQLLDKDRENDKLQTTIADLQIQLTQRPPLEAVQRLQKECRNLELILQGTQRENERCMAELDRPFTLAPRHPQSDSVRAREKLLEQALAKLAGENWQAALDITPSSTFVSRPGFGSSFHNRSQSSPAAEPAGGEAGTPPTQASVEATRSQIEQIRLLVLGMEQRMQEREEKLNRTIERAEAQEIKCEALRKEVLPPKVAI
ncbi:hypothetical protein ID866_4079 [Astraeus odoratus]|nr:hypothetical protein ID866_4079 [Astraeus odoratus]